MTPAICHIPAPISRPPAPAVQWRALHPSTPAGTLQRSLHRQNTRYIASCVGASTDTPTQLSSHSLRARTRRPNPKSYVGMSRATPSTDTPTRNYNYQLHCVRTPMWQPNKSYVGCVGGDFK